MHFVPSIWHYRDLLPATKFATLFFTINKNQREQFQWGKFSDGEQVPVFDTKAYDTSYLSTYNIL